jgi:hypothetical protein
MSAQHLLVAVLAVVNAVGGTMQFISLNWWFYSFQSDTMGAYPILVLSSGIYVVGFGAALTYVWLRYYSGHIPFTSLFGLPRSVDEFLSSPFWTLICIGFNDALNGVLAVTAAPPDRTPPVLGTMMGGGIIVYSLIISKYYLKETTSFGRDAYIAVLLTLTGIYVSIMPTIQGGLGGEPGNQVIFWCTITLIALLPGAMYNAQQKKFILQSSDILRQMKTVLGGADSEYWAQVHFNLFTLFVGCVWQLVFMTFFFWIMLINVPSLNWMGTSLTDLGQQLQDGFGCFFGGGTPTCQRGLNTLYGVLFNTGYFATYIASIYLNLINLPLSMISGQLQGPLSALVLLIIPSWDLNGTGAQAYSILPALVLQMAALTVYELWRKEQADEGQKNTINGSLEGYA